MNSTETPRVSTIPISAEELHENVLKAFRLGNHTKRKLLASLLAMSESQLYKSLGFSHMTYYIMKHLICTRSHAFALLRVAHMLEMVPLKARDKPNTPQIVRKVTLRDGRTCSNPMCGRSLGTHAHHIQFRSNGGRPRVMN